MNNKKHIQLLIIFLIIIAFIQCDSEPQSHKCGAGQSEISQDTVSAPLLSPAEVSLSLDSVLEDNNQLLNSTAMEKDCTYTKYPNKI